MKERIRALLESIQSSGRNEYDRLMPCGYSGGGIYIRGDKASIDKVRDAIHKAAQIEEYQAGWKQRLDAEYQRGREDFLAELIEESKELLK